MDVQRFLLFIVFSFSSFMLWQAWEKQHAPVTASVSSSLTPGNASVPVPAGMTAADNPANSAVPGVFPAGARITVHTDLMEAQIDANGGDLRSVALTNYRDPAQPTLPFHMFEQSPDHLFIAQSGLIGKDLPTHKSVFQLLASDYVLQPGQDSLSVPLVWRDPASGVEVEKRYTFHRDSYVIDVSWKVVNAGSLAEPVDAYFQFVRDGKAPEGESRVVHTFTGPALYTKASKFTKLDFKKLDKGEQEYPRFADNGWIAMVQHHFVSVWLPANGPHREFYANALGGGLYKTGVILSAGQLTANGSLQYSMPLYVGPQIQKTLTALAPGLDYVVDYGWLTPIAVPIFWVLQHIHAWVGNWGWAIVILTIGVKLLFFPLSAKSYRSMAQMRGLAPKLQRLKELHGDDREKLHLAMMELYKTEKVNPLGGCLPTVVQIPVFIALYWTLVGSVEMRQAPFIGWIHDLSAPDPYYVLPIIMGLTMLLQTRLNPAPPDPMQAKVMLLMPVVFSVFFLFFPSGLVLYWVVNNMMSISQQWVITRRFESGRSRVRSQ